MNDDDTKQALDLLTSLWPKWKPNKDTLDVFASRLERLECDFPTVKIAIQDARANSRWHAPTWPAVHEALARTPRGDGDDTIAGPVQSGWWVVRLDKPTTHELSYPAGEEPPPERLPHIAEKWRQDLEDQYGGQWVVVRDAPTAHDARYAVDPVYRERHDQFSADMAARIERGESATVPAMPSRERTRFGRGDTP